MKGVKNEEDQGKWSQEEKAGKRKTVTGKVASNNATSTKQSQTTLTVQTNDASATKTVAERMKEQGEGYVEDKSVIKTPVEAQWLLKLSSTTFNVRAALLAILKCMATVDDTIYLETGKAKVIVRDTANLPMAKEFTKAFKVTQKEERNRPTWITIYFMLYSKVCLNTIKFNSHVWSYIQKTN
eukprot:13929521-Ditylum_brightwellii.AAC.1